MNIAILGTGAYGMALASILYDNKCNIKMWTNSEEERDLLIRNKKSNKINFNIPDDIVISTDMKEVVSNSDVIIFVTPVMFINDVCKEIKKYYNNQIIGVASKGIINNKFLYDIIKKNLNTKRIGIISGSTFAEDILKKRPMGINIASKDKNTRLNFYNILNNDYLKINCTKDVIGTELCGAIKNVYAIGMGMLDGMNALESTKAMYLTNVVNEIKSLIKYFSGDEKTILSYAGIGDLFLTCNSIKSRNYSLGKLIGEKRDKKIVDEYIDNTTIEGLNTLKYVSNINLPIINKINDIINWKCNVKELEMILIKNK